MVKKKSTNPKNEIDQVKKNLKEKEEEVQVLQEKIKTMENHDPLANKIYYTFYQDTKRDILAFIEKEKSKPIKEIDWHSFVDKITQNHDPDMAFFLIYALIDLFNVPFTSENAKKYIAFCVHLANILRYCQG